MTTPEKPAHLTDMATKPTSRIGQLIFGVLFAGIASVFIVTGSSQALNQARLLADAQEIPAVVDDAHVDSRRGNKGGITYQPKVGFHFQYAGATHHSDHVHPLEFSTSSRAEADALSGRFIPGQEVIAWRDPQQPEASFLIRQTSFSPYLFILFPMIHFCIGLFVMLLPGTTPAQRPVRIGLIAGIWCAIGVLCAGHFALNGGTLTTLPLIVLGVYALASAGWIYAWRRARAAAPVPAPLQDEPNPFRQSDSP